MTKQEKIQFLKVLKLLVSNDCLSASRAGLAQRAENRDKAIGILLDELDMTYQDVLDILDEEVI